MTDVDVNLDGGTKTGSEIKMGRRRDLLLLYL